MVAFRSSSPVVTWVERVNTTFTAPSGITNGDRLLLLQLTGFVGEATDPTPPSGFDLIAGTWPQELDAFGFNVELSIYEKIAASESGNYTTTHSNNNSGGVILCISDPGALSPANTQDDGVGTTATAPGLTATANSLIIIYTVDFIQQTIGLSPPSGTTPTFTERHDDPDQPLYVATGVYAAGGATGDKSMTVKNNSDGPWMTGLIAVEPSGIEGPAIPQLWNTGRRRI